ncbi:MULTISPECIES: Tc toxin subunit A [Burkholderia]|uniref:Tc toxin subunit A n=1 Tax=Burkholderia TaxID=32008 RepID=UPI0008416966|nr:MULTISPECIES: Tc toxin subunit A [unclassified Burkholderia]AOK31437.1 hypothetical protein AQ611_17805 [Burkholderia sp. Bp7605]
MTSASPFITRIEDIFKLAKEPLAKLGYRSVFDFTRISREQFIRKHHASLGRHTGDIYDLAIGFAHQISHRFQRKYSTLHGAFSAQGPEYSHLFPDQKSSWKNKAPVGSPEANDGPVSYLAYIYHYALGEEDSGDNVNKLADRRPDIGQLVINDAALNEVIPQIQLVNEILNSAIQNVKQLSGQDAVNALLATTRYPNTLPYHYGHQQIQAAQGVIGTTLQDATLAQSLYFPQNFWAVRTSLNEMAASALVRLQVMASQFSPEQQQIIIEPAYFGHRHLTLSELSDKWLGPSLTESLPYEAYYSSGAFVLPLQSGIVDDYSGRPGQVIVSGETTLDSIIKLYVTNGSGTSLLTLRGRNDKDQNLFQINDAVAIQGEPYNSRPLLRFSKADNTSLNLSRGPWYNQFRLSFQGFTRPHPYRDLTISLFLSDDRQARYNSNQKQFYQKNFGSGNLDVFALALMSELTSRTGLTVPDVEKMLCATAGGKLTYTVIQSGNFEKLNPIFTNGHGTYPVSIGAALPFVYGAKYIHAGLPDAIYLKESANQTLSIANLTDDRLDRINRMVRLQKWLGLPFEDIDLLVTSAIEAENKENPAYLMNDNTLRMLGVFKHYQSTHGVTPKQFAAWLYIVTPFAITPDLPFFDQIFNSSGAFDTPLVIDNQSFVYTATTDDDNDRVQKICTALGLNHRQFLLFADKIAQQFGNPNERTLYCSIFVVSAFYRLASLARVLGIRPEDFCALIDQIDGGTDEVWQQLAGQPVIALPTKDAPLTNDFLSLLQALSAIANWQQQYQLPFFQGGILGDNAGNAQGTAGQLSFIQQVWQSLPATFVDDALLKQSGAPPSIDWLKELSAAKLVDSSGLVTDLADDQVYVEILGRNVWIIKAINDTVDAQALTNDDKSLAKLALNATIIQSRQTQHGMAISLLAQTLNVDQTFPALLMRWIGYTIYQWLSETWALRNSVTTPLNIPSLPLNVLRELARRALLCQYFSLSPALLQMLLAYPEYFALTKENVQTITLQMMYMLSRYQALLAQISSNGTEDDVLAYLQAVNATVLPDEDHATTTLATLLGWERNEVRAAWSVLGGIAKTVPQLDIVLRLQQAESQTGLTVNQQQQAFKLSRDSSYDIWQAVGQASIAGATHVNGGGH